MVLSLAAMVGCGHVNGASDAQSDAAAESTAFVVAASNRAEPPTAEQQAIAKDVAEAPYIQSGVLHPIDADSQQQLVSFCLTREGHVVALVHRQRQTDAHGNRFTLETSPSAADGDESPAEVRVLAPGGELVHKWPVDFLAQAVNVGVDGHVVLGGDGMLARYTLEGEPLAEAEAPHLVAARQDPEAIEKQAREIYEEQAKSFKEALQSLAEQKKSLTERPEAELSPEECELKNQMDAMIASYQENVAQAETEEGREKGVQEMKDMLISMQRKINAIAAGPEHVFITCATSKGFGYSVWRTDLEFQNPTQIVDGLSGCCGQMDVQCCGGELIVAENSRHRVVRYDADGQKVESFGQRSREGEGEKFGGCCNPMNTRLCGDRLYVAESDGRVKLFSLSGKFLGLAGKAEVTPGCKSSIVDVSPSEDTIYYFDVHNSAICVLERRSTVVETAQALR